MKRQNVSDKGQFRIALYFGCITALISAILAMLGAYMIMEQIMPQNADAYLTPAIIVLSVLLCSYIAAKKAKEKKLLAALGSAAVYFSIALIAKMAFFPGETIYMLRNSLITLATALGAGIFACAPKGRGHYQAAKRR